MTRPPRAVVVLTGSELARGAKADANGPFLARELTSLGLEPARLLVVGDRPEELESALREGLAADLCVVSGGLGPTHDDRTIEVLAAATGRGLVVDPVLEGEIEAVARRTASRLGRAYADFSAGVRKQATLPEGGTSLGLAGTAPAVVLDHGGGVAVALPGPPGELRRLWPAAVASDPVRRLLAHVESRAHRVLRLFGPSESAVARALAEAGGEDGGVEVTVCAADLEIQVDLYAGPGSAGRVKTLERALRERFSDEIFADAQRSVAEIALGLCRSRDLTLATAESCTGGLVAAELTAVPGASDVFLGGLVAYADAVKVGGLAVPDEVLGTHGAVSAEAACGMARGARRTLGADVAVAVTGIAGPGGGTEEKPVGLVFIAVETPDAATTDRFRFPGDRDDVRRRATVAALHLLRRLLAHPVTDSRASGV